ncbi:MAG: sensor histidine kinase, partial [Thermoguttaceae bacterium]
QYIGDNTRFLRDAFDDLKPLLLSCKELADTHDPSGTSFPSSDILESLRQSDLDYLIQEIPLAIEQSLEGVERVSNIVRSMKEFSHPGTNQKQAIDLNRAIENTLTVARNEWKYVSELNLDLAEDLPPVLCLPGDLNQVFLNLIVNAAHAMKAKLGESPQQKGTLTVRTMREGENVIVQIQDTGTGIPANIHDRVYDPFFTTKKVGQGTGQGLTIARSIVVDRHGGSIGFETELGQGTTFTICIPLQPSPSVAKDDA